MKVEPFAKTTELEVDVPKGLPLNPVPAIKLLPLLKVIALEAFPVSL